MDPSDKSSGANLKPRLSFWQIWNMSFGFLGIQFGFALQNANVSRIFESLDAEIDQIPILWIAAPVTGLIVQPIIGYMSDKTWNRFGRRRPYFLAGAILASAALFIMPNSPFLWVAAGMLWILDASINISMEPFRAFVGDMLPSEQRTLGFSMQSFFIGFGAVVGSALPYILTNWFDVANTTDIPGTIVPSVKLSFYIGGSVFLLAILWTVLSSKEYSPEMLEKFESSKEKITSAKVTDPEELLPASVFMKYAWFWIVGGMLLTVIILWLEWDKELYILSFGFLAFGLMQLLTGVLTSRNKTKNGFVEVINDLYKMPPTMKQLAWVQFFSWFALFSMWIYTTAAVTSHIYLTSDTRSELYNEGANWVGIAFSVYNGFAAVIAFLLPVIAKHTSRRTVHIIALTAGGLGLMSIYLISDPDYILVSMLGVGFAWASILAMPYAILTGSLPAKKMGVYMGIFNFFIVIPQIVAASILGFMVRNFFNGEPIYAIVAGGVSLIVAAFLVKRVEDVDEVGRRKAKSSNR